MAATPPTARTTPFTRDVLGRYICNGLDEALASADQTVDIAARPRDLTRRRPFDIIVVGGGSFGLAVAERLFADDNTRSHRVLVLEAGPLVIEEHVQNYSMLGLNVPGATSIQELRAANQFGLDKPREEVWGLPWHSSTKFQGLAYCVAGRSLYWGGWSPEPLAAEMPTGPGANTWPANVVAELSAAPAGYFQEASDEMGVTQSNDFMYGPLHMALRSRLFNGVAAVQGAAGGGLPAWSALPFAGPAGALVWPDHPAVRFSPAPLPRDELLALLGLPAGLAAPPTTADLRNLLKLEAPLAVQARALPGQFPLRKYSSLPILMQASRTAGVEASQGTGMSPPASDINKRLMIVPLCHVTNLQTVPDAGGSRRVTKVDTSQGSIDVSPSGTVIIALGTIESARMALNNFAGLPTSHLIGQNLQAHMRTNLTIRIPAPAGVPPQLSTSALLVKGSANIAGRDRFFHLQITATGMGPVGTDSEADLFKIVPDVDLFEPFVAATDSHVVVTIRGLGEMEAQNPNNHVTPDPELDEFLVPRALVSLTPSGTDNIMANVMDAASDAVALVLANGQPYEVLNPPQGPPRQILPVPAGQTASTVLPGGLGSSRRDGIGSTFHEAGTLWMGNDPTGSVTNPDGRFHFVSNTYAVGPALLPSTGSPNPMLTGIALARRTSRRIISIAAPPLVGPSAAEVGAGFQPLFDGSEATFANWNKVGPNSFALIDGEIVTFGSADFALLYYAVRTFADFTLRLQFRVNAPPTITPEYSFGSETRA